MTGPAGGALVPAYCCAILWPRLHESGFVKHGFRPHPCCVMWTVVAFWIGLGLLAYFGCGRCWPNQNEKGDRG